MDIYLYKGRKLSIGEEVEVYRNLHNNLFSIRSKKSRLVLAHGENFALFNAVTKVSESGRQKVIREKRKNVHAWVSGTLVGLVNEECKKGVQVTYDPYKDEQFRSLDNEDIGDKFYFESGKMYRCETINTYEISID